MEKLGEFLGWCTGICFMAAVLTYIVKRVNKRWILPLPKESPVRQLYGKVMKWIIKYHRYFGLGAAAAVALHLAVQLTSEAPSYSGLTAAALLLLTVLLGTVMLYGRKGKLLGVHRVVAAGGLLAFLVHLLLAG